VAGNIVWVVTTTALMIGLPMALAIEDEARVIAQEKEMMGQQQGQAGVSTGLVGLL
jgi:import receptor subunit TOM22